MRLAAAIIAALLFVAAPARAAEVSLTVEHRTDQRTCGPGGVDGCSLGDSYDVQVDLPTVRINGTSGPDDLAVTLVEGTTTVRGGGVTASDGCEQAGAEEVRCTDPPPHVAGFRERRESRPVLTGALGGGDDRLVLTGSSRQSIVVDGDDGADTLTLETGTAVGGAGNDVLFAVLAEGGEGDDRLATAGGLGGLLSGGPGADALIGAPASATTFAGGPGPDTITAGTSPNDSIDESTSTEPVVVDLTGAGRDGADVATGVESAYGGAADDTLIGTDGANRLVGNAGDDTITGHGGVDTIRGEDGADTIDGGAGADDVRGGLGVDRLSGGDGDDYLSAQSDVGKDPPAGTGGRLDGGPGNDHLFGAKDPERITGGAGDDEIDGDGGRDRIAAGAGDDRVLGGQRRGRIDLGPGDDVLDIPNSARFTCGAGTDLVTLTDAQDLIAADCERVNPFLVGPAVARPRFVAPRSVAVPLNGRCERSRRCRITVRIRGVASRTVRTDGHATVVRLPFPRARRGTPVAIVLRAVGGAGRAERAVLRLTL